MRFSPQFFFVLVFLFGSFQSFSQGTIGDYKRAESLDTLFKGKIYKAPQNFHWTENGKLWYVNNTKEGKEYLLVSPDLRKKERAFDHQKLAQALSKITKKEVKPDSIEIHSLTFDKTGFTFVADTLRISSDQNYDLRILESVEKAQRRRGYWGDRGQREFKPVKSPDGKKVAFIKNYDLYISNSDGSSEEQSSYDGSKGNYYSGDIMWSPDSEKILAYKVKPGQEHKIYLIESSPKNQLQPILHDRNYLKPGDELQFKSPQLFHVEDKRHIIIPTDLFNSQYSLGNFQWLKNSSAFTFEYNQRGHQVYRIISVDAETGKPRAVINETSPTFIDYSGKKFRYDLPETSEIIWASERDGWNHLYLYDSNSGNVKNKITTEDWPVREVLRVDNKNRQIYFTASGIDKKQDPYFLHYFRIDFDGKHFKRYTEEDGNHKLFFSPDSTLYVDQYSRVDLPPVSLLKAAKTSKSIMKLEEADISDLKSVGWRAPEVFTSKGRDGKTDIWGIIVRPTNFDPSKKYPIIENIYAGPQDSFVPKDFHSYYWSMSSLAELGFIVVQIDGMGTSNRSKAFHDVCWKNLKDAGFPDRKLWIKAVAKKYPYLDIDRVGIRGTSAGGQNAAGALVFNSDFYDVAVASCGCHDNRMDKMWWNEQWMGYPIGPEYEDCSNIENAHQMKGDLLLMVGEIDDNVDPATTMQFADALIKAGKDFELVVLPGMSHTSGGEFGERKRRDFFVQHLLKVTPPSWSQIYN